MREHMILSDYNLDYALFVFSHKAIKINLYENE